MKYAASMRYGGELIAATDADYDSYKHLGLLCPECKEPVFLRAEGTRVRNGKEIPIGAHFCHFQAKDVELAKECENRIGGYTKEEIEKRAAVARGQRLKLMQKWFWEAFCHANDNRDFPVSHIYKGQKDLLGEKVVNKIMPLYRVDRRKNIERIKKRFQDVYQALLEGRIILTDAKCESAANDANPPLNSVIVSRDLQYLFFRETSQRLNTRLHRLILNEVFDFVFAFSNQGVLKRLFVIASYLCFDAIADGNTLQLEILPQQVCGRLPDGSLGSNFDFLDNRKNLTFFYSILLTHVFVWISTTPWAEEFERLPLPKSS